jgi:hypothetical protein
MIYGPPLHATNLEHLNNSSAEIYGPIDGSQKSVPETNFCAFVDVRDVAEAHRLAYEKSDAGVSSSRLRGLDTAFRRFVISSGRNFRR